MREEINKLFMIFVFLFVMTPGVAKAFYFGSGSATAYLSASSVPKTLGNITSGASGGAAVQAYGNPNSNNQDLVKIQSVSVGSAFTSQDFTVQIGIAGTWTDAASSAGRCVWYNNCDTSQSGSKNGDFTRAVTVRLKRTSTAAYTTIPSGTTIAVVQLRQYSRSTSGNNGSGAVLTFKLNGDLTPITPTCNVKDFDKTVTLPSVMRPDLVSHGVGRYTGATKEFTISLECEHSPKVSVKFDGDKMPGITSEDVLVNKSSGNDNVGIQILYSANPLKIGEKVAVLSSADDSEALKFNAYYYYKGGDVQSGPVKSQSEFLFSYE